MRINYLLLALCLAVWLLLMGQTPTAVHAASLTVYPNEVAIADNGRCSLREAIVNANDDAATHPDCPAGTGDDVIIIPAGTYTLDDATAANEDFSLTGDLDIRSNITLQGAGADETILDGNGTDRVLHVVSGVAEVNDMTIRNGRTPNGADAAAACATAPCSFASWGSDGSPGGGVFNASALTLNRVIITHNKTGAGGVGGNAICSSGSCTTSGGESGRGAGIFSNGPNLTIHNSVIQHNETGAGGAAGVNGCTGTATCSVRAGSQGGGGGVAQGGSSLITMNLSSVAANSGGIGGGMYCGVCAITHSAIHNNASSLVGGGIFFASVSVRTVSHTIVANNTARTNGGGIYINGSSLNIANVTLSGNTADVSGGGFFSNGGATSLNYVTIANNRADADSNGFGSGGGIYVNLGTVTLGRSLVSGNIAASAQEIGSTFGVASADNYNVFGRSELNNLQSFGEVLPAWIGMSDRTATTDGTHPTLLTNILNPTLGDNGGSTLTTHALVGGSPAIDIIPLDSSVCILDTSTDQRGAVRGSGPNRGDGACDAGAFEFNSNQTPTAVTHSTFTNSNRLGLPGFAALLISLVLLGLLFLSGRLLLVSHKP